jgi:hypothetical protein
VSILRILPGSARPKARRVLLFSILAVKNSRRHSAERWPALPVIAETSKSTGPMTEIAALGVKSLLT